MILDAPSKFPNIPLDQPLIIDVETTSFDDDTPAFEPFKGHRVAGYAIGTLDAKDTWYLPIRHGGESAEHNCDLQPALAFMRDLIGSGRDIVNHNIKFDARFWHQDGCKPKGRLMDTMTLARLVDNDKPSYSLSALTQHAKLDLPSTYCKERKTKDYGKVPIPLMARYAALDERSDVRLTARLYNDQLAKLPAESSRVWATEIALTKRLADAEIHGIKVNVDLIKMTYYKVLKRMMEIYAQLNEFAGREIEPGSHKDIDWLLIEHLGFKPTVFTETGRPKWTNVSLSEVKHPAGELVGEYQHLVHFSSTYCDGWLKRVGDDGRLHCDFRQSGTRTGRLSSGDPNMQNVPVEAEVFVQPDEGHVLVGFDYSQIEYRMFAHYANDPRIIKAYNENKDIDYHQSLADMLGVDRQFAKSLNFAFLYGLGKKKLLKMIAGICAIKASDEGMKEKMRNFLASNAVTSAEKADALGDLEKYELMAQTLYDQYHREVPTIRQLSRRVEGVINARGWIKNFCGRVYRFKPEFSYRGLNYLIQGSCADVFKEKLVECVDEFPWAKMLVNVHDSIFFSVPADRAQEFYDSAKPVLEKVEGVRVPVLVEGKVSRKNWSAIVKVKDCTVTAALDASDALESREWGTTAAVENTHGRLTV